MNRFLLLFPLLLSILYGANNVLASSVYPADNFASIDELGRLFTDKVSRSKINNNRLIKSKVLSVDDNKDLLTKDNFIKLNGFVIRKNTLPVVWINNKVYSNNMGLPPNVFISADSSDTKQTLIRLKHNKSSVNLKSGQFWSQVDKSTHEGYELSKLKRVKTVVLGKSDEITTTSLERTLPR